MPEVVAPQPVRLAERSPLARRSRVSRVSTALACASSTFPSALTALRKPDANFGELKLSGLTCLCQPGLPRNFPACRANQIDDTIDFLPDRTVRFADRRHPGANGSVRMEDGRAHAAHTFGDLLVVNGVALLSHGVEFGEKS